MFLDLFFEQQPPRFQPLHGIHASPINGTLVRSPRNGCLFHVKFYEPREYKIALTIVMQRMRAGLSINKIACAYHGSTVLSSKALIP